MSLIQIALRIAAVEALKGRTIVGENVLDSPNGALDIAADGTLRTEEDRPFVSVFTDEAEAKDIAGRGLLANGVCVLVIEAGISMAMTDTNDKGESVIVGAMVPASDRNFEFTLGLIQRQVGDALTDPGNAWAEIWRGLSSRIVKTEVGSKRTTADGSRLAARQVRIWVDLVDDPVKGESIDGDTPMGSFLAALEASADADSRTHAVAIRGVLGSQVDPDWMTLQRRHGMTAAELLAIGCGPLSQDSEGRTPPFFGAEADVNGLHVVLAP